MSKKTKIVFIINPIAGKRKHKNIEGVVQQSLSKSWTPVFVETEYGGHAGEIVEEYLSKGIMHFIAVGGDGTVSEVATGVFKGGATLGIIPCGSGNGLARTLNIPIKPDKAIACINENNVRKIDTGKINEHHFFCTCGVGFDAKIGAKFAKQTTRGFSTYLKTTIKEFYKYKSKKYKLKIDGKKFNRKAFLISVANAGQYGNNAYIAPKAQIDDGILEVCALKPFPLYKSLGIGLRLFARNMDKSKYLETIKGKSIVFRKKKKYPFHIDGDPIKLKGPVQIEIINRSLKILTPRKSKKS